MKTCGCSEPGDDQGSIPFVARCNAHSADVLEFLATMRKAAEGDHTAVIGVLTKPAGEREEKL